MPYGLHSYHSRGIDVRDYRSARACLEACQFTPTGRRRKEKLKGFPLGAYWKSVTWVQASDDSDKPSIRFHLYSTDVVTYEPNGDIVIDNYGTKTTTEFASKFLPRGFHLSHPVESRQHGTCGHHGIYYRAENDERRICWPYGTVTFRPRGKGFVPLDAQQIDIPVIDSRKARKATIDLHLREFKTWLEVAPPHGDFTWEGWDEDECLSALRRRDFPTAARHCPLLSIPEGFRGSDHMNILPFRGVPGGKCITPGVVESIRLAGWEAAGAVKPKSVSSLSVAEWERLKPKMKKFEDLGISFRYAMPR